MSGRAGMRGGAPGRKQVRAQAGRRRAVGPERAVREEVKASTRRREAVLSNRQLGRRSRHRPARAPQSP